MSTQALMMDNDSLANSGPEWSMLTMNPHEAGPAPKAVTFALDTEVPGRSPRGGIGYIDQAAGGMANPRGDVFVRPLNGIVGPRQRQAPFEGQFLGNSLVVPNRLQGFVGRRRNGNALAESAQAGDVTALADPGEQVAGFFNPAAARILKQIRKGRS